MDRVKRITREQKEAHARSRSPNLSPHTLHLRSLPICFPSEEKVMAYFQAAEARKGQVCEASQHKTEKKANALHRHSLPPPTPEKKANAFHRHSLPPATPEQARGQNWNLTKLLPHQKVHPAEMPEQVPPKSQSKPEQVRPKTVHTTKLTCNKQVPEVAEMPEKSTIQIGNPKHIPRHKVHPAGQDFDGTLYMPPTPVPAKVQLLHLHQLEKGPTPSSSPTRKKAFNLTELFNRTRLG